MSEYQLSWSLFQNNLRNGLSQLQQNEEFVDMTLAADGHLVKVHRNIMSVASPYIKEMLQSTTCRDPIVFLNNISSHNLSYILEYIYTGEVKVPKHALASFIKAGKALHITGVKDLIMPMLPHESSQSSGKHKKQSTESLPESVTIKNQHSTNSKAVTELNRTEVEANQPIERDIIEMSSDIEVDMSQPTERDKIESGSDIEVEMSQPIRRDKDESSNNTEVRMSQPVAKDKDESSNNTEVRMSHPVARDKDESSNNTEVKISQPIRRDKIESSNNTDLQTQSYTNVETDVNSQKPDSDVECMDVDIIGPQISNIDIIGPEVSNVDINGPKVSNSQVNKEKSILEKALENIQCVDSYETSYINFLETSPHTQGQSDVAFNIGTDVIAIPLNNDQSTAPMFNLEIKSCEATIDKGPPTLCINISNDLLASDSTSVVAIPEAKTGETHDASAPLYSLSERGCLQLILNRFIYNLHHSSFGNKKRRWRCKDYRKLNCKACIDTMCDKIIGRRNEHTHGFHDDKILVKGSKQNIYATSAEAEAVVKLHRN